MSDRLVTFIPKNRRFALLMGLAAIVAMESLILRFAVAASYMAIVAPLLTLVTFALIVRKWPKLVGGALIPLSERQPEDEFLPLWVVAASSGVPFATMMFVSHSIDTPKNSLLEYVPEIARYGAYGIAYGVVMAWTMRRQVERRKALAAGVRLPAPNFWALTGVAMLLGAVIWLPIAIMNLTYPWSSLAGEALTCAGFVFVFGAIGAFYWLFEYLRAHT